MPEFILDSAGTVHNVRAPSIESVKRVDLDFCDLDAFTQGYIEALFFTESSPAYDSAEWFSDECKAAQEEGQADGNIPGDVGFADLAPDSLAKIIADCAAFQSANAELLELAFGREYDAEQAGRDFWYTRNGHGVGYWDRKALEPDSDEYERLTGEMIAARDNPAKWGAALAQRKVLQAGSIGERLSNAARKFGEVYVWFGDHVEHGDAPLVHVN